MADALTIGSLALLGYFAYKGYGLHPQTDNYQVTGSSDVRKLGNPAPVYSNAEDGTGTSGVDSQVQNPMVRQKKQMRDTTTYHTVVPNGDFSVKNEAGSDQFNAAYANSKNWLSTRPSSVPISQAKRGGPKLPRADTTGRAMQYLGAADTTKVGSTSFSMTSGKAAYNQVKQYTDYSRNAKSFHLDTLYSGTFPPYAIDPESPHNSDSFFTQSMLGQRATKSF